MSQWKTSQVVHGYSQQLSINWMQTSTRQQSFTFSGPQFAAVCHQPCVTTQHFQTETETESLWATMNIIRCYCSFYVIPAPQYKSQDLPVYLQTAKFTAHLLCNSLSRRELNQITSAHNPQWPDSQLSSQPAPFSVTESRLLLYRTHTQNFFPNHPTTNWISGQQLR